LKEEKRRTYFYFNTKKREEVHENNVIIEFQIKVMVPLGKGEYSKQAKNPTEAIICVHTKHNGYHPSTKVDKMFLPIHVPIHPLVISFAVENLKYMISTSTVALASIQEEIKIQGTVDNLECVTSRFFLIAKGS